MSRNTHAHDRRTKHYRPKRWTLDSALLYAAENVSGKNTAANIPRDSNVDGAARLCAWALARAVHGARVLP